MPNDIQRRDRDGGRSPEAIQPNAKTVSAMKAARRGETTKVVKPEELVASLSTPTERGQR